MRLLFASVGRPHCPKCGQEIRPQTVQQMVDRVMALPEGSRLILYAPYVRGKKGEYRKQLEQMARDGFVRARIDGEQIELRGVPPKLDKQKKHTIDIVVDRLVVKPGVEGRLAGSLETALKVGDGLVVLAAAGVEETLSQNYSCADCGTSLAEITPRLFSFNSPYGACAECSGLGTLRGVDEEKVIADPERSISAGAIAPWPSGSKSWRMRMVRTLVERARLLARHALAGAAGRGAPGDPARQRQARDDLRAQEQALELQVARPIRGHRAAARAALPRHRLGGRAGRDREVHVGAHLPELRGPAAARRGAGGDGGRHGDRPPRGADRGRAGPLLRGARSGQPRAGDRRQGGAGDRRPAGLSGRRRGRLSEPRPRLGDAVGRREPADPAGHADRQQADGRALRPRRALDRAAPARQRPVDRHAAGDARPGQLGAGGRARRGDHPGGRLGARSRARGRHPRRRGGGGRHARGRSRPTPRRSPASTCAASARCRCRPAAGRPPSAC